MDKVKCRCDIYGNKLNKNEYGKFVSGNYYYTFAYYVGKKRSWATAKSLKELREKEKAILYNFKRNGKYVSFSIDETAGMRAFLDYFKHQLPDTFKMLYKEFLEQNG